MECYRMSNIVTCQPWEKFCYKEVTMFFPNHPVHLSGCASECTETNSKFCCTTDKCNGAGSG
uniref:Nakoroxin n=1 Tax=Naja kaouthia TaxID=8649 RepID=3SX_NAJKA|nr:RecName: Full=Nakoroxin; AltName: Full=Naja kaouthia orphan toxin; AltName: Full=Three-finger toxin; Short=3FTx [Naja kaouthia]